MILLVKHKSDFRFTSFDPEYSRAYQEQKALQDEQLAKEKSIKDSNKREAQMCIELAEDALSSNDYSKAEKFFKKAAKLDFDLNLGDLLAPVGAAREAGVDIVTIS